VVLRVGEAPGPHVVRWGYAIRVRLLLCACPAWGGAGRWTEGGEKEERDMEDCRGRRVGAAAM
jgi:hypothetical protein